MSKVLLRLKLRRLQKRARLLIEHAEALRQPLKEPLLLFSVSVRRLGRQLCRIQRRRDARACGSVPGARREPGYTRLCLGIGHSIMGVACATAGKFLPARAHHDQALVLCDPTVRRALFNRFAAHDELVVELSFRSLTMWMLGYPDAALADAERALQEAREIDHAFTLMHALWWTGFTKASCGCYTVANAQGKELVALADQNSTPPRRVCRNTSAR